jgi:hypothetical protein
LPRSAIEASPLGHGVEATHAVSDAVGLQDLPLGGAYQSVDAVVRRRARDGVRSLTAVGMEAAVKEHGVLDDQPAEDDRADIDEILRGVGAERRPVQLPGQPVERPRSAGAHECALGAEGAVDGAGGQTGL